MEDSKNGINHKCPCCGYEVEYDWRDGNYIKGDESFIRIDNPVNRRYSFETDRPNYNCYGTTYEEVILLGCPKCHSISFEFD